MSLHDIIEKAKKEKEEDRIRHKEHDGDLCMACHSYGADKRSLMVTCFYDIKELVPEFINLSGCHEEDNPLRRFHYMRICKTCRGRFLKMLKEWFRYCTNFRDTPKNHDGCVEEFDEERNIPVRINGATVMMDEEEFKQYNKEKQNG